MRRVLVTACPSRRASAPLQRNASAASWLALSARQCGQWESHASNCLTVQDGWPLLVTASESQRPRSHICVPPSTRSTALNPLKPGFLICKTGRQTSPRAWPQVEMLINSSSGNCGHSMQMNFSAAHPLSRPGLALDVRRSHSGPRLGTLLCWVPCCGRPEAPSDS